MSLSSAKIRDHAVIEQFRAAGPPRLPELPRQLPAPHPIRLFWPRSRAGPLRPRE